MREKFASDLLKARYMRKEIVQEELAKKERSLES